MTRCDVTVIGGGPAGSACAAQLAAAGLAVRLVHDERAGATRPAEVLAPPTLRRLRAAGLAPPDGRRLRGVLSRWADDEPAFFDYVLYACEPALAVDRTELDARLRGLAGERGATVLAAHRVESVRRIDGGFRVETWCDGAGPCWSTRFVVFSSGKSTALGHGRHAYEDRLIALWSPLRGAVDRPDLLLLEATEDGWWYIPGGDGERSFVVLVTDVDLLPRGRAARAEWFAARHAATRMISRQCPQPLAAEVVHAVDARTGRRTAFGGDGWCAIGDAAWSNDPLSGSGILCGLEAAGRAATAIHEHLEGSRRAAVADYVTWCAGRYAEMLASRAAVYRTAATHLADHRFWRRRTAGGGPHANERIVR